MADVDGLNDAGAADGEKDLVADFLMREQDKLAGLEEDFENFGTGDSENTEYNATVGYGTVSDSGAADFDAYVAGSGADDEYGMTEAGTDPYNQVKHLDKRRAEPEKIRIWREEQTELLKKKDAESERQKAEWREQAKHELEDWYKHRTEQLEKQKKVNRQAPQGENEDAFVQQRDERKPGGEWERVCHLCDFNPKSSRNSKDITRMRSILLQLKQAPAAATAEG